MVSRGKKKKREKIKGSSKEKAVTEKSSKGKDVKDESRLTLLKKKLELEQEILETGNKDDEKLIERIDEKLEETKDAQESEPSTKEMDETESMVANLVNSSKEKQLDNAIDTNTISQKKKLAKRVALYQKLILKIRGEVGRIVVGQSKAVSGLLRALFADGHVLIEGVPGIAKTTLIRTLAQTTGCTFSRIQFTPDLLPTDIIGISTYQEGRGFYTLKGPIFNNFILADEINRAPPKVQSALLECMAEKQATIAKESFPVPIPFFTMATQNPLESVGTYSLPEAQMDRFLFKVFMDYPDINDEQKVLKSNITSKSFESYSIKPILDPDGIIAIQNDVNSIYVDPKVERYIVKIVDATRNPKKYNVLGGKYVEFGASPRGSIGIFKSAKADALMNNQSYVTPHNVKEVAYDVLRHRIILSYEGQAEGVKSEKIVEEILRKVPVP